jgi:hypothetical protein
MPVLHHISRLQEVRVKSLTRLGFFKKTGPKPLSTSTKTQFLHAYNLKLIHIPLCWKTLKTKPKKLKRICYCNRSSRLSHRTLNPQKETRICTKKKTHIQNRKTLNVKRLKQDTATGSARKRLIERSTKVSQLSTYTIAVAIPPLCDFLSLLRRKKCNAP